MKLNEALQRAMITVKNYIDKVTPAKLSDLEIDMELGIKSWDDLENKPFYKSAPIETILLEETSKYFPKFNSFANITMTHPLEVGKTYKVRFDEVEYECVAYEVEYNSTNTVVIGNAQCLSSYLPSGNNEPFLVYQNNRLYSRKQGNILVSIKEVYEEIVTLSEEFIPNTIARTIDVVAALESKADANHNHNDIYESKTDAQSKYDELMYGKSNIEHTHNWNNLEGKPFGEETSLTDIVNGTFEFSDIFDTAGTESYSYACVLGTFPTKPFKAGEIVTVVIDGIAYELVNEDGFQVMYNPRKSDGFIIGYYLESGELICTLWDTEAIEHTIYIGVNSTSIKCIDEKYIPDTIARISDLPTIDTEMSDESENPVQNKIIKEYVDSHILEDEEVLRMLAEANLINITTDENGDIFTDLDGNIIVF